MNNHYTDELVILDPAVTNYVQNPDTGVQQVDWDDVAPDARPGNAYPSSGQAVEITQGQQTAISAYRFHFPPPAISASARIQWRGATYEVVGICGLYTSMGKAHHCEVDGEAIVQDGPSEQVPE